MHLYDTMLSQYSMKKIINLFRDKDFEAVTTELQQLYVMKKVEPMAPEMTTRDLSQTALRYLIFLKQKRCGKIKGPGCADGRK